MLVQQPEEYQQRSAAPTTTSTTAISASGLIRPAHRLHASRRHHYIQLSADTSTTTTSASVSASTAGTTFYLSCSASSVTRVSTPRPHAYDISSINNMYGCGRGQPPGIGGHRHHLDINQLNREHLRYLPSVTPVLLRRLHLGTSQIMYLFNLTTLSFLFLQLPIKPLTLRIQRHLARLQQHQLLSQVLHL